MVFLKDRKNIKMAKVKVTTSFNLLKEGLEQGFDSAADNQNWISGDVTRNGNMAAEARHTIHTLF